MTTNNSKPEAFKIFSTKRILLVVILGLVFIGYLVYNYWNPDKMALLELNSWSAFWIVMTVLLVVVRMLAYMARIRTLSHQKLNWKKSFQIISIWEFASAVTPSIIGGTAVAMFLLAKEKISLGKSTAIVLLTAFLDELFFIIFAPVLFLIVGKDKMFPNDSSCIQELNFPFLSDFQVEDIFYLFFIGYGVLLLYTLLIAYGLFVNPSSVKHLLTRLFSFKLLKRWRRKAYQTGIDIEITADELKKEKVGFWGRSFGATILAWLARYFEANFIILAFVSSTAGDQLSILSRSFVMWIIMMLPTTPGSSGVAETAFISILCEYLAGAGIALVILWRLFSYYPYLIIGTIVLPRWIKRVFSND